MTDIRKTLYDKFNRRAMNRKNAIRFALFYAAGCITVGMIAGFVLVARAG